MAAISVAPLSALLQDLTLLVTAIGLLCGDMFLPHERAFLQWLTVVGAITALAAIVAVSAGGEVTVFDGMFCADGFGALLKAVCVMALAFKALMSESFFFTCPNASGGILLSCSMFNTGHVRYGLGW